MTIERVVCLNTEIEKAGQTLEIKVFRLERNLTVAPKCL